LKKRKINDQNEYFGKKMENFGEKWKILAKNEYFDNKLKF